MRLAEKTQTGSLLSSPRPRSSLVSVALLFGAVFLPRKSDTERAAVALLISYRPAFNLSPLALSRVPS